MKADAAWRAIRQKESSIAWNDDAGIVLAWTGDAGHNLTGLLNKVNIPEIAAFNGAGTVSPMLADKTPDEIWRMS
jgi:hypothetical protein